MIARLRRIPVWIGYGWGPRAMSRLRVAWLRLRNPHVDIRFEGPVYLGPGFSLHAPNGGRFLVGPAVEFRRGFRAELGGPESTIRIGGRSVFTYYVLMQCTTSIEVGEHCMFGQSTIVVDGNHRFRDLGRPMLEQGYEFRPIRIEDHATVTTKCTIISDVGERAFVGANTLVVRPVPPFCVVGGVPAKVLEYFGPPGQEPPELAEAASS